MSAPVTAALVGAIVLIPTTGVLLHRHAARCPAVLLIAHKLAAVAGVLLAGRWLLHAGDGTQSTVWLLGAGAALTIGLVASGGWLVARPDPPTWLGIGHRALGFPAAIALAAAATAALLTTRAPHGNPGVPSAAPLAARDGQGCLVVAARSRLGWFTVAWVADRAAYAPKCGVLE